MYPLSISFSRFSEKRTKRDEHIKTRKKHKDQTPKETCVFLQCQVHALCQNAYYSNSDKFQAVHAERALALQGCHFIVLSFHTVQSGVWSQL